MAKEGLGCLWLHVRCCLVGVFPSVKPTANVFSFEEKADLAGKGFVCPGPSKPSLASSGGTPLVAISDRAKNSLPEAAFWEPKLCSGKQLQPQCILVQDRSAGLVLP